MATPEIRLEQFLARWTHKLPDRVKQQHALVPPPPALSSRADAYPSYSSSSPTKPHPVTELSEPRGTRPVELSAAAPPPVDDDDVGTESNRRAAEYKQRAETAEAKLRDVEAARDAAAAELAEERKRSQSYLERVQALERELEEARKALDLQAQAASRRPPQEEEESQAMTGGSRGWSATEAEAAAARVQASVRGRQARTQIAAGRGGTTVPSREGGAAAADPVLPRRDELLEEASHAAADEPRDNDLLARWLLSRATARQAGEEPPVETSSLFDQWVRSRLELVLETTVGDRRGHR